MGSMSWYAIVALLCAVNLLLSLRLARRGRVRESPEPGVTGIRIVVVLAWAYAVVPGLVQLITEGRRDIVTVNKTEEISAQTGVMIFALSATLILTLALVVSGTIQLHKKDVASPATTLAILAPWAAMTLVAVIEAQPLSPAVFIYPLMMVAFWRTAPPLSVASLLGGLVVFTAALSLSMGATGSLATVTDSEFTSKSLVSNTSALAGPFTHPNQLGSFLALGLPSVLLIRNPMARGGGIACIAAAVLWSASRTSIVTVLVVLVLYVIGRRRYLSERARRTVCQTALGSALLVMVVLPLATHSSSAFSQRGQVWIASIARWQDHLIIGSGPLAYRSPGSYAAYLGPYAYHGHNMLVNTLALGGLVGIACTIPVVVVLIRRSVDRFAVGKTFPALFTLSLLIDGILEVSTDFWSPSPTAVVVWISVALVAFSAQTRPGTEDDSETDTVQKTTQPDAHRLSVAAGDLSTRRRR